MRRCFNTHTQRLMTPQYPSPLRRFAIVIYDSLLIMAVSIFYGIVYLGLSKLLFNVEADRPSGILFQLGWLLTFVGFYTYFWRKGNQTTGMRAWRVKIQSEDGNTPNITQCLLRLITAPIAWPLFFTAFSNAERQWLHDKLSKTQLILLEKEKK